MPGQPETSLAAAVGRPGRPRISAVIGYVLEGHPAAGPNYSRDYLWHPHWRHRFPAANLGHAAHSMWRCNSIGSPSHC